MTRFLLALLAFYKRWLSPAMHTLGGGGCKYRPTCSEYAAEAIAIHGPVRGSGMAIWRLLRCHPFTRGGFDPVPIPPSVTSQNPTSRNQRPSPHEPLP